MSKPLLAQLVLLLADNKVVVDDETPASVVEPIRHILRGESANLLVHPDLRGALTPSTQYPTQDLHTTLIHYVEQVAGSFKEQFGELAELHLQVVAIAMLQVFIQANYTGPGVEYTWAQTIFPGCDEAMVNLEALRLLALEGQTAYDLVVDPLLLVVAALLFERLQNVPHSLINKDKDVLVETVVEGVPSATNHMGASLAWWRARLLQVHQSLFSEHVGVLTSVTAALMNSNIANLLCSSADGDAVLQQHIQTVFLLESARYNLQAQTEHLAIPHLAKALEVSDLQFVLSGAKAKRTKYQTFHASALIVLARSKPSTLYDSEKQHLEDHQLDSDLLLEKPQFESLDDMEFGDEPDKKKIRFDEDYDDSTHSLLPIAVRQETIPAELKELDPNDQPPLNDLDYIQLLLRLTTLKQTSPADSPLVDEQLLALVGRVLHVNEKTANWLVFARALWERSMLETHKARTVERGILQMTSLVEEIGIKVKTKVLPAEEDASEKLAAAARLRFIHQLPLMPQWLMDARLAEKYMSIGILRSALEIYQRLQMVCEAALCLAAVDNEAEAERMLEERVTQHPEDARALSILGDIKQDPRYWEKAWELGRYAKAKASLSRYFYSPPPASGQAKSIDLAIRHMHDCLSVNPISYENWFFYGCLGIESEQYELAAEAFTRCVALDDSNSHAWSNLGLALLKTDKIRPAFNALKKAIRSAGENKKSWRIYENYLIVAAKLHEWNDVLMALKELLTMRAGREGDVAIDVPVLEKLVEILVATEFPHDGQRLTHYQALCIELICVTLPNVINSSARCWRLVLRVEMWRRRPWAALEGHEKAYRALAQRAELDTDEAVWNEAVEACVDLVAAYENYGELPGKHGAGDVVCKDWKYKARTTVRSLMSKGKQTWEDLDGWTRLEVAKEGL